MTKTHVTQIQEVVVPKMSLILFSVYKTDPRHFERILNQLNKDDILVLLFCKDKQVSTICPKPDLYPNQTWI